MLDMQNFMIFQIVHGKLCNFVSIHRTFEYEIFCMNTLLSSFMLCFQTHGRQRRQETQAVLRSDFSAMLQQRLTTESQRNAMLGIGDDAMPCTD